jgi:hypothetical protein
MTTGLLDGVAKVEKNERKIAFQLLLSREKLTLSSDINKNPVDEQVTIAEIGVQLFTLLIDCISLNSICIFLFNSSTSSSYFTRL